MATVKRKSHPSQVDVVDHDGSTKGLSLGGTLVTATAAELNNLSGAAATATEINSRNDDSAMTETRADAGAISTSKAYTAITTTGAAAVTLAVPTKPAFIKVIKMTTDGGDATLALTNVVGGSAATTCTFNDVGDTLVLVSDTVSGKWVVLKEVGVTMA